jgi:glycosyltransferase involved in cell wall biosynthesis
MVPEKEKKLSVGILTPPVLAAGLIPLTNLVALLSEHSLYLVTVNEGSTHFKNDPRLTMVGIQYSEERNNFLRIFNYFYLQLRISIGLMKVVNKCDIWIFFLGGETLVFPMIIAKFYKKKVFLFFGGSAVHIYFNQKFALFWLKLLTYINCTLSDKLILYSGNFIKEWNLEKWVKKITFAHEHIVDFQKFRIIKPFNKRENIIGFTGRFSQEKGIWNFVQAIDLIVKDRQNIMFLIAGEGLERGKMEEYLDKKNLRQYVKIKNWIPHDNLPLHFNELKLLVIPSYTEGLPNVMLESMACGTPVLATPVGMIPAIIENRDTGFILKDNSPQSIAEGIIRAFDDPDIEQISLNARRVIESEFSIEKTIQEWKQILDYSEPR